MLKSAFFSNVCVFERFSRGQHARELIIAQMTSHKHIVFTRMQGESYRRRLGSLLCLCDVFRALINSPVYWLCMSALGLVFPILSPVGVGLRFVHTFRRAAFGAEWAEHSNKLQTNMAATVVTWCWTIPRSDKLERERKKTQIIIKKVRSTRQIVSASRLGQFFLFSFCFFPATKISAKERGAFVFLPQIKLPSFFIGFTHFSATHRQRELLFFCCHVRQKESRE